MERLKDERSRSLRVSLRRRNGIGAFGSSGELKLRWTSTWWSACLALCGSPRGCEQQPEENYQSRFEFRVPEFYTSFVSITKLAAMKMNSQSSCQVEAGRRAVELQNGKDRGLNAGLLVLQIGAGLSPQNVCTIVTRAFGGIIERSYPRLRCESVSSRARL
jgi:hypothetical protein